MKEAAKDSHEILHEDPISSTDDSHDKGLLLGTTGGAVAGGALGSSLGPLGAAAGVRLGATAGSIVGLGISKSTDNEPNDANNIRTQADKVDTPDSH